MVVSSRCRSSARSQIVKLARRLGKTLDATVYMIMQGGPEEERREGSLVAAECVQSKTRRGACIVYTGML